MKVDAVKEVLYTCTIDAYIYFWDIKQMPAYSTPVQMVKAPHTSLFQMSVADNLILTGGGYDELGNIQIYNSEQMTFLTVLEISNINKFTERY